MGYLFGRTGCNEGNRNWEVVAYVAGNDDIQSIILTEQLSESDAKAFYSNLMEEVKNNKTGWIDVIKSGGDDDRAKTICVNLKNVIYFTLD